MRAFVPLILVACATCFGCRSRHGERYDYWSLNRHSLRETKEFFKEGNEFRKKSWHNDMRWKERAELNRRIGRESAAFGWHALWDDEARNAKMAWDGLKGEATNRGKSWRYEAAFGFTDTGPPGPYPKAKK